MTARFWHGVIVDGKLTKVLADVPTLFVGKLAPVAPKLPKPTPKPAKPKKDDAA